MKMRKMLLGALGLLGALFWVSGDGALYAADAALTIGDPVNVGNPTTFSGVGGTNTAGGALDTVIDGQTGVLFEEQCPESLACALERVESIRWDRQEMAAHAATFSVPAFKSRLQQFMERSVAAHRQQTLAAVAAR